VLDRHATPGQGLSSESLQHVSHDLNHPGEIANIPCPKEAMLGVKGSLAPTEQKFTINSKSM
jgi:hypothetical protein